MTGPRPGGPRLAVVSRGDPLTSYLHAALAHRFDVVADIDVELRGLSRAAVGAATFRPTWARWTSRYMKSNLGFAARSAYARRSLARVARPFDVVVQTHALFQARSSASVVYVDCTYREAVRGWPAWAPLRGRARARWLRAEERLYRDAAHVFTLTSRSRDSLLHEYGLPAGKVTVVGAGVNFDLDPSAMRRTAQPGARTVLFVGKEFDRKGGPAVLAAFAAARRRHPDIRLQVVGAPVPGPVPDGVDVLGAIDDRARMDELYASATVFCLASQFDPAPMVVLEAMAHGLPCVLSRGAAAHVESLVADGSGGWVADVGDTSELADGLCAYLDDPALARRVGDTAQRAMSRDYTWARVVERMAPDLERLASGAAARSRS